MPIYPNSRESCYRTRGMNRMRLWGTTSLACAFCAVTTGARAQDPQGGRTGGMLTQPKEQPPAPTVAQPVIVMPILKKDDGAQYPVQAVRDKVHDKITVDLIVELTVEGLVKDATVVEPKGHGFDEAALEAAQRLEFEPATRDGKPIAAKIRHRYEFAPPAGRIRGKVVSDIGDRSLGSARVVLVDAQGAETPVAVGADGTFVAEGLAHGAYTIKVEAEAHEVQSAQEVLEPGEEIGLTLRLIKKVVGKSLPEAPPVTGEEIEEVEVRGVRPPREVTKRTLEQRELQRIPGTGGDALRALQNLPGIARPPGLAGLLIVRGSAPNDTNVFADGTLVPIVYHFGGLSSVIPTEALEKLDFFPGNFSAQYGRVTGGVVDIGIRDPRNKDGKIHGIGQVDLIDARLFVEGPIGKTGWNFIAAGRRSYIDTWLKPVLEQANFGVTTAPVYYDYQLLAFKQINDRSSVRLAFLGSDDRLDIVSRSVNGSEPGFTGVSTGIGFWRAQARYKNRISDSAEWKTTAAVGQDFITFNLGNFFFKLKSTPIAVRSEISQKLGKGALVNFGVDWLYAPYDISVRLPPPPRPGEAPSGPFSTRPPLVVDEQGAQYRPAVYTEFELTPVRGMRIVPGLRLDYTRSTKSFDLSPRVVARQDLHALYPRTTLKGGVGVFRQPPQPQETSNVFGQSGLRSNVAHHYSFGGEQEFTRNIELSTEGFYKDLRELVVARNGNNGTGRVFGLETLFRYKPSEKFFGWIAYTLSRSERRDSVNEPVRLFQFDQTHILTVLGSYRLGGGWEIGARFRYVSGSLTTPNTYGFYDGNSGSYLADSAFPPFGERLPSFQQLDIRVDKIWKWPGFLLNAYLDVQNVYNAANVEGLTYNFNFSQRQFGQSLPFLPNLGLRGEL